MGAVVFGPFGFVTLLTVFTGPPTAALMLMSGVPRWSPTTRRTSFWKPGRSNTADTPPPPAPKPSFHTWSGAVRPPVASRWSCVPPSDVTSGSEDGQEFTRVLKQQDRS